MVRNRRLNGTREIERLQEEKGVAATAINDLQQKNIGLQERWQEQDARLEELQETLQRLRENTAAARRQHTEAAQQLAGTLVLKLDAQREQLNTLAKSLNALNESHRQAKSRLEQQQAEAAEAVASLQAQKATLEEQAKSQEAKEREDQQKIADLQRQCEALQQDQEVLEERASRPSKKSVYDSQIQELLGKYHAHCLPALEELSQCVATANALAGQMVMYKWEPLV